MKKHLLLILAMPILLACTSKRADDMFIMYNFPMPKIVSFDLTTQTVLHIDTFKANIPDTLAMDKLDVDKTIEVINIITEAENERNNEIYPPYYENRHFYIYGKFDLQSNINSIVLYDTDIITKIFPVPRCIEHFWLFNFKDNKLCSAVRLDNSSFTIKNNIITDVRDVSGGDDYNFLKKIDCVISGIRNRYRYPDLPDSDCFVKTYYTKYKINEQGYIEFVK